MNAHATIDLQTDLAPDIEIAALNETIARAEMEKANADKDISTAEEAIRDLDGQRKEFERALAEINAVIVDEGKARAAAIERWRKAHVTLLRSYGRKSQIMGQETR